MLKKIVFVLLIIAVLELMGISGFILPKTVSAQTSSGVPRFSGLITYPDSIGGGTAGSRVTVGGYIGFLIKLGIALAAIFAVIMIIIGGIMLVAAGGNPSQRGTAKTYITDAIVGLLIAVGFYVILYTINPQILGGGQLFGAQRGTLNNLQNMCNSFNAEWCRPNKIQGQVVRMPIPPRP